MTGTFSASSQASPTILVRVRESVRFVFAGTWVGKAVVERTSGDDGWKIIRHLHGNIDSTVRNILEDKAFLVRLRVLRLDSGSIDYTLEDVAGDKVWTEQLPDGTEVISVTDEGNLYVRGELFSGSGGGGGASSEEILRDAMALTIALG